MPEGSRAMQTPFGGLLPPLSGGGPPGDGSKAPEVFWGELSLTWGKVLHVFLQHHLLPQLILVLPGPRREVGGGGLAQMGLGVEWPLLGQLGRWGRTWMGRERGRWGSRGCRLTRAVPRPWGLAE